MQIGGCDGCYCESCLLHRSGRCPHGSCYDDLRAKYDPYDVAHPNDPPRDGWSHWETDQAYWCRGGICYPVTHACGAYKPYTKPAQCQECLDAIVTVFEDGYISCGLVDCVGCEACYTQFLERS